jgi:hypothetical protein
MVRDSLFFVEKRLKIYGKLKKKLLMKEHQSAQISPRFFDLAKLALNLSRKFYLRIFDDLAARLSSARVATRIIFPRKRRNIIKFERRQTFRGCCWRIKQNMQMVLAVVAKKG